MKFTAPDEGRAGSHPAVPADSGVLLGHPTGERKRQSTAGHCGSRSSKCSNVGWTGWTTPCLLRLRVQLAGHGAMVTHKHRIRSVEVPGSWRCLARNSPRPNLWVVVSGHPFPWWVGGGWWCEGRVGGGGRVVSLTLSRWGCGWCVVERVGSVRWGPQFLCHHASAYPVHGPYRPNGPSPLASAGPAAYPSSGSGPRVHRSLGKDCGLHPPEGDVVVLDGTPRRALMGSPEADGVAIGCRVECIW